MTTAPPLDRTAWVSAFADEHERLRPAAGRAFARKVATNRYQYDRGKDPVSAARRGCGTSMLPARRKRDAPPRRPTANYGRLRADSKLFVVEVFPG